MTDPGPAATGPSHEEDLRSQQAHARRDRAVPTRTFLAIGGIVAVIAAIYALVTYEEAGMTMLVLATALALWVGVYLWLQARPAPAEDTEEPSTETYLPHESVWPVGIGAGAFFAFNGLLLGPWFLFPGAVLLVISIAGWARQSRYRT
jgi:hypothetical protein